MSYFKAPNSISAWAPPQTPKGKGKKRKKGERKGREKGRDLVVCFNSLAVITHKRWSAVLLNMLH